MKLTAGETYKELRLRGYDYGKSFQGILESNHAGKIDLWVHDPPFCFPSINDICVICASSACFGMSPGDQGKLQWTGNWVTFLDTMLQMLVVGLSGRSLRLPTRIRSVCVDPVVHLQKICKYATEKEGM